MKILILAGGTGTRLWPVSRKKSPKQIKPLLGKNTLLKDTVLRVKKGFGAKDIYLSVNQEQLKAMAKDLGKMIPKENYIVEPVKRDTAAAIGLASVFFCKKNPREIVATVNSDHYVKNTKEFLRTLKTAERVVKKYPKHLVLIGLNPTYPETGYGYIKLAKSVDQFGQDKIFTVEGFKEKPDLKIARQYLKSWAYLWNPAYFVFQPETMLDLFKKHLPDHYRILMKIKNQPKQLAKEFKKIKKISIDYGIMEKAGKMLCLPASFDWADIGHWRTIHQALAKRKSDNIVKGKHIHLDSKGNLIYSYSNKLVATVGVRNFIIIETDDALLICPKNRAQEVKKIVEELERRGMKRYL